MRVNLWRRVSSALLALVLLVSCVPTTAFAENSEGLPGNGNSGNYYGEGNGDNSDTAGGDIDMTPSTEEPVEPSNYDGGDTSSSDPTPPSLSIQNWWYKVENEYGIEELINLAAKLEYTTVVYDFSDALTAEPEINWAQMGWDILFSLNGMNVGDSFKVELPKDFANLQPVVINNTLWEKAFPNYLNVTVEYFEETIEREAYSALTVTLLGEPDEIPAIIHLGFDLSEAVSENFGGVLEFSLGDEECNYRVIYTDMDVLADYLDMIMPQDEQSEPSEPLNITDKVELELTDWKYNSNETLTKKAENGTSSVSYDASKLIKADLSATQLKLHYSYDKSEETTQTDKRSFEVTLPAYLSNLSIAEDADAAYTCTKTTNADGSTVLIVELTDKSDDKIEGDIVLNCSLNDALLTMSGAQELVTLTKTIDKVRTPVNYQLVLPDVKERETLWLEVSGTIDLNETATDGKNWRELLRPNTFNQPIKITAKYKNPAYTPGGDEQETLEMVFDTQDNDSKDIFYFHFDHDGEGEGSFTIANVPRTIEIDGKTIIVESYDINIEPTLPYYQAGNPINISSDTLENKTTGSVNGELSLNLKTQKLTLQPTVNPPGSEYDSVFEMTVVYNNANINTDNEEDRTETTSISEKYDVSSAGSKGKEIDVPVGLDYTVTETQKDGYKQSREYGTKLSTDDADALPAVTNGNASGTIVEGVDVTVTTENYPQNVSYSFYVDWIDNNKANRPDVTSGLFTLQYKTADGDWAELDDAAQKALGMTAPPTFGPAAAGENDPGAKYVYSGLPAADANHQLLSYRIVPKRAPNKEYTYSENEVSEQPQIVTFEEQTTFNATIRWNDDSDPDEKRPESISSLKLYRRIEGGRYEEVSIPEDAITKDKNTWKVTVPNLPRYDRNNHEYDYVLVAGEITYAENGTMTVTQSPAKQTGDNPLEYRSHYNNGSSNYGTDTELCHNGGTITEILTDRAHFSVKKVWKGPANSVKPESTVTLWRYVESEVRTKMGKDYNVNKAIDYAYENGLAAPVVYSDNGEEKIVSETLSGEDEQQIPFNSDAYSLPGFDDQGRRYVYFARETLSEKSTTGVTADEYGIKYYSHDGNPYANGAPNGGTITNVRHEKVAVLTSKLWKSPEGLDAAIAGSSVQLELYAKPVGSEKYKKLPVLSETTGSYDVLSTDAANTAQTITGFNDYTYSAETKYYVNLYDEEGNPYDMANAVFTEIIRKEGTQTARLDKATDDIIIYNGKQYKVSTSHAEYYVAGNDENPGHRVDYNILSDGMKQYRYIQTNTIYAVRDYTLNKVWSTSIKDSEFWVDNANQVQSIVMHLYRRSTNPAKSEAPAEFVGRYTITRPEASGTDAERKWSSTIQNLPKYDNSDGYSYYYYATEVGFNLKDGKYKSFEDANSSDKWSRDYVRTPDFTSVNNYKASGGYGYFSIGKSWNDGTGLNRPDVYVRIYRASDLNTALSGMNDDAIVNLDALKLPFHEVRLTHGDTTTENKDLPRSGCTHTFPNTPTGDYTQVVNFEDLGKDFGYDTSADAADKSWASMKNFVVVEYQLGRNGETARYTAAQLQAAVDACVVNDETTQEITGQYKYTGTVSNGTNTYDVQTETMDAVHNKVMITNIRTGKTNISAQKTWNDEKNKYGKRPTSVTFQIYKDGEIYKDIPASVTVSGYELDKDELQSGATASLDHATGVVTLMALPKTNAPDVWKFEVHGLPMYDSSGAMVSYSLDENAVPESNGYTYTQRKRLNNITGDGNQKTYNYEFVNTIESTTSHVAYKVWHDNAVGESNRPDLYMTLYRYQIKDGVKTEPEQVTGSIDQQWTPAVKASATVDNSKFDYIEKGTAPNYNFDWKITVDKLPKFDKNGVEYIYEFRETMNNNGHTVNGDYKQKQITVEVENDDGIVIDTYEVFTNTISDGMTITGKKTWTGLAGYQVSDDKLPNPKLMLYRTTDKSIADEFSSYPKTTTDNTSGTPADLATYIQQTVNDPTKDLVLVNTTYLDTAKKTYTFPDSKTHNRVEDDISKGYILDDDTEKQEADRYKLPKYDPQGNRYYYLIFETIVNPIADQLYSKTNANGTLSNTFKKNANRRQITVTKEWIRPNDLTEAEKVFPSVTYKLSRYELGNEERTTVVIETKTIPADKFKQNPSQEVVFDDLLIFSPTGVQYGYFVEEQSINSYNISYTDEPNLDSLVGETYYSGTYPNGTAKTGTITQELITELKNNNRLDIISCPTDWNQDTTKNTAVSTKNEYDTTKKVQLHGTKVWNDYNNMEGLRPDGITITLKRSTGNETGQSNKVVEETLDLPVITDEEDSNYSKPYIVWNYGTNKDKANEWSYVIYNLERYAPNGMPYTYVLSETAVTGYKKAPDVSKDMGGSLDDKNDHFETGISNLTNDFDGSYYVRKIWSDGYNKYNLRPTEITVVLERTKVASEGDTPADDAVWERIEKPAGTSLPSVVKGEVSDKTVDIVSTTLTSVEDKVNHIPSNVRPNTRNSQWEYTFTNLPTKCKDGNGLKYYVYRCVEVKIGSVELKENDKCELTAGAYKYTAGHQYQNTVNSKPQYTGSVLTNTLDDTSLTVTKTWIDDSKDLYHSRPAEIRFTLEKRGVRISEEGTAEDLAWDSVKDADNKPYVYSLNSQNNWTVKLEDLPAAQVVTDKDGKTYTVYNLYFRAVEIKQDGTEGEELNRPVGAENYEETTKYSPDYDSKEDESNPSYTEGLDHYYDKAQGGNISKLKNRLILADESKISVTKVWNRVPGDDKVEATFELLYSTDNVGWYSFDNRLVDGEGPLKDEKGDICKDEEGNILYGDIDGITANNVISEHTCTDKCVTQTVSSFESGRETVTWEHLPKYNRAGELLYYKVVEHPVPGYKTEMSNMPAKEETQPQGLWAMFTSLFAEPQSDTGNDNTQPLYATDYTFTNTQLKSYSVQKVWYKTKDGAADSDGKYTATFKLQQYAVPKTVTADSYNYGEAYKYVGNRVVKVVNGTEITAYYSTSAAQDAPMNDMARYLGALYHSGVNEISYDGKTYTWNESKGLQGSNWCEKTDEPVETPTTLVSAIVANVLDGAENVPLTLDEEDYVFSYVIDDSISAAITPTAEITANQKLAPTAVEADTYNNGYTYVGKRVVNGTNITAYYSTLADNKAPMNDMARYLGALYRCGVNQISYGGKTYTWKEDNGLQGSNWCDESGNTLVKAITTDVVSQTLSSITLTADGTSYNFSFVINDSIFNAVTPTAVSSAPQFVDVDAGAEITVENDGTGKWTGKWDGLPIYTTDGEEIIYRAVETAINGNPVNRDTDGNYVVSYLYDGNGAPTFEGTVTKATNRMVYGFVNLSKQAAYLAPGVTETGAKLENVTFDIYKGTTVSENDTPYISGITTDKNGNLIANNDGTYGTGTGAHYLVPGPYTIKEASTNTDYSVWSDGVAFTVGVNGTTDTGEHGTAWVITDASIFGKISLKVEYKPNDITTHTVGDGCKPQTNNEPAYNIESRGVLKFTKTDVGGAALDTHANAAGESTAYFGVYLEEACTTQIAGMTAADGVNFVLTDKTQNGAAIPTDKDGRKDSAGVPYLRKFGTDSFTLLTGDYYIKELVAPPGYKLDTTVRKVTVPKITATNVDTDLSSVYPNNVASIDGLTDLKWINNPNVVELHKMDQYGRNVTLKDGGYLLLEVVTEGVSFKTGENTIRLYQSTEKPATKTDGETVVSGITYANNAWTITGLFDIGKTYTLSEPDSAVPDDALVAKPFSFTVNPYGTLSITPDNVDAVSKTDDAVLNASGTEDDENNYYNSNAAKNIVVLRDVVRNWKNVRLRKIDTADTLIQYISFRLYKCANDDFIVDKERDTLIVDSLLTTDENGIIDTSTVDAQNKTTGAALKYGLEIGKYYFVEVEQGASDRYILKSDPIFFEIRKQTNLEEYQYGASYEPQCDNNTPTPYRTDDFDGVDSDENGKIGIVKNIPVEKNKTLSLTKADGSTPLPNAYFTLTYETLNKTDNTIQTGAQPVTVYNCKTDAAGVLKIVKSDGTLGDEPDISNKGTYTLVETGAPAGYITPTDADGKLQTMLTFTVNSECNLTVTSPAPNASDNKSYEGSGLVKSYSKATTETTENGIKIIKDTLTVAVENKKTTASFEKLVYLTGAKLNGAAFEIRDGETVADSWTTDASGTHSVEEGKLHEGVVYKLVETTAPQGYLEATDVYFMLWGSTEYGESTSRLYIWTGESAPTASDALTLTNWKQPVLNTSFKQSSSDNGNKNNALVDNTVKVIDEPIIAPVTLKKMLSAKADGTGELTALQRAKFSVKNNDDNVILGTAITDADGYLVWESINGASEYIYYQNKPVTAANKSDAVSKKTIILRQNNSGYTFTEIEAPAEAFNEGRSYVVAISDENYTAYKADNSKLLNAVKADADETNHFTDLEAKNSGSFAETATQAVNKHYESTVTLHKYDADREANKSAIANVSFTLYYAVKDNDDQWVTGDLVEPEYYTPSEIKTDSSGNLNLTVYKKGDYILKETAAEGYDSSSFAALQFTLVNDDNVDYGFKKETELKPTTDGVPNDRLKGTVTLTKQGSGETLNDVEFTLTKTSRIESYTGDTANIVNEGYTFAEKAVVTGKTYSYDVTTDTLTEIGTTEKGKLVISGLDWGDYSLTESKENSGYVQNKDTYTFMVDKTHLDNLSIVGTTDGSTINNARNSVVLHKTDLGTTNLSGAVFEIHEGNTCSASCKKAEFYETINGTVKTKTVTSGADGKITIYGLPTNNTGDGLKHYHLVETTAPKGYEIADPVQFTINRDGKINSGSGNEVLMEDKPIEVKLLKWNNYSTGSQINDDSILATAQFQIIGIFSDTTGTTAETRTFTGAQLLDVSTLSQKLVADKSYTLKETKAPEGYERQTAEATFTVNKDGTLTITSSTDSFLSVADDSGVAVLTYKNTPIELKITKQALSGIAIDQSVLNYAEFSVTGVFAGESTSRTIDKTASDAPITTANFTDEFRTKLVSDKIYKLSEIKAPDGYVVAADMYFVLGEDGKITKLGSNADAAGDTTAMGTNTVTLNVRDDVTKLTVIKKDDNGNLEGAVFTLTAVSANPAFVNMGGTKPTEAIEWTETKISWTSTTSETGFAIENHLITGVQYKLEETRVYNHEAMSNPILFTLDNTGNITIDTNSAIPNNTGYAAAENNTLHSLTINNPIVKGNVTLTKTADPYPNNATKLPLANAEYLLFKVTDENGELLGGLASLDAVKTSTAPDNSSFLPISVTGSNGVYAYASTGTAGQNGTTVKTDSNGEIVITKLPEGKYYFIETNADYAYHISNAKTDRITFEISNGSHEAVTKTVEQNDERINAKISLTKLKADGTALENAVFDVSYSTTENGDYSSIGTITTGSTAVTFSTGKYPNVTYPENSDGEGLRRGWYKLTEIKADNQMLNTLTYTKLELYDAKRNSVKFEIGNEVGKTYVIGNGTGNTGTISGNTQYIHFAETGLKDTPIPTKTITMTKKWEGDSSLAATFRPKNITVQLKRSYTVNGNKTTENVDGVQTVAVAADGTASFSWNNKPAYVNIGAGTVLDPQTTFIYTYFVEEVNTPYGYTASETHHADGTNDEGNVTSTLTNTMETGTLSITKRVQGVTTEDTFKVRVTLKNGENTVGNNTNGYYVDKYMIGAVEHETDTDGWMSFNADETITINLPAGVSYTVEEKSTPDGTDAQLEYIASYTGQSGTIAKDTQSAATITNNVKKQLKLTKTGIDDASLADAEFELSFKHLNSDTVVWTKDCKTGSDGVLYLYENGEITNEKPDLTDRGVYELYETKAPAGYITPTQHDTAAKALLATITVDTENNMTVSGNNAALVTVHENYANTTEHRLQAVIGVKNEPTKVRIGKTVDYANGAPLAGAKLEIYEGAGTTGNMLYTINSTTTGITELPKGTLKENQLYTLHEVSAPTGYLEAADVYFKLEGTYTDNNGDRYSRIVLCEASGAEIDQNKSSNVYGAARVVSGVLNMADETIKAPVTLNKVVSANKDGTGDKTKLPEAVFEVYDLDKTGGESKIGTAKTDTNGYLVWESITNAGKAGLNIYTEGTPNKWQGTALNTENLTGKTIVLKQNTNGYRFKEISAPDHAYNDAQTYTVKITDQNYTDYKEKPDYFVNIVKASENSGEAAMQAKSAFDKQAVNPKFETSFQMYKYDAEHSEINADHNNYDKIGLVGVEFTLYRKGTDGSYAEYAKHTTGADGLLSFTIDQKGEYKLKETKSNTGFGLNPTELIFTVINSDQDKTLSYKPGEQRDGETTNTVVVMEADGTDVADAATYDMPNSRHHGTVTLLKKDADSGAALNGVKYTLTRIAPDVNAFVDEGFPKNPTSLTLETGKTYTIVNTAGAQPTSETNRADDAGKLIVNNLQWGTYQLVEQEEIDGYIFDTKTFSFTVSANDREKTVTDEGKDHVTNTKNHITINKVDEDGKPLSTDTLINEAEFKLYKVTVTTENDVTSRVMSETPAEFYASAEATTKTTEIFAGRADVYGLAAGSYVLKELKAPAGYKLASPLYFSIDRYGKITELQTCTVDEENAVSLITAGTPSTADDKTTITAGHGKVEISGTGTNVANTVTVTDEPIKVYVAKFGETDNALNGAVFELKDSCKGENGAALNHKLANKADSYTVTISENGKVLIPEERIAAGHTYTLTETAAPAGYECTADVTFTVDVDGKIKKQTVNGTESDMITTDTLYTKGARAVVAYPNGADPTIQIHNELIRATLTKVDSVTGTALGAGAKFELSPVEGSNFGITTYVENGVPKTIPGLSNGVYYAETNDRSQIDFPAGLLKYGNTYLLRETKTVNEGYYLDNESRNGITLSVNEKGELTVGRPNAAKNVNKEYIIECLTSISNASDTNGVCQIQAKNYPTTAFDMTKLVEGNMGDLTGKFPIRLEIYEPDGSAISPVSEKSITLGWQQKYDSETGLEGTGEGKFGKDAIPVGAKLVITEANELYYTATVRYTDDEITVSEKQTDEDGIVRLTLNKPGHISIELVNTKEVPIDVGILTEGQTPLAFIALIIPALWLGYRYKKKRVGGDYEE